MHDDPWGDTRNPGGAARRGVGVAAWVALALAVASGVLGVPRADGSLNRTVAVCVAAAVVAVAVAAYCLWHAARHSHERGRGAAVAALFCGVLVLGLLFWPIAWGGSSPRPPVRAVSGITALTG